jgi:hypothetical protein
VVAGSTGGVAMIDFCVAFISDNSSSLRKLPGKE